MSDSNTRAHNKEIDKKNYNESIQAMNKAFENLIHISDISEEIVLSHEQRKAFKEIQQNLARDCMKLTELRKQIFSI